MTATKNTSNQKKGNRCGCTVDNPSTFKSPSYSKRRPKLIEQAKYRLNSVTGKGEGYRNFLHKYKEKRRQQVSNRQMRLEGRSRIAIFGGAVFDHLDLETMQLGYWCRESGQWVPTSWDDIHNAILDSLEEHEAYSYQRLSDEKARWKACGFLRVKKRYYDTGLENDDGSKIYRQDISASFVTEAALVDLGLHPDAIKKAREESTERNEAIRKRHAEAMPFVKTVEAMQVLRDTAKNYKGKVRQWYEKQVSNLHAVSQKVKDSREAKAAAKKPQKAPDSLRMAGLIDKYLSQGFTFKEAKQKALE